MCEVLNRIYGWKLENLNHVEKNFPGIDLGDWERGIGVQVTVEKTSSKINNTIAKIVKNEVYNKFPHLKILILAISKPVIRFGMTKKLYLMMKKIL